ncbi:hypothetical protein ACSQ67_012428 [Phaseolus vulgaris]
MRLRYPHTLRPFFFSSKLTTMTPQTLFHAHPFPTLKTTHFYQRHRFLPHRSFFTVFCSKPTSRNSPSPLRTNGYHGASHASIPRPVQLESPGSKSVELQFNILKKRLEAVGMETGICVPGQYNHLLCPECQGGERAERSLSLYIAPDGGSAAWVCFRGKCGWKGNTQAFAGGRSAASKVIPVNKKREITEEELQLEPLCDEVIKFYLT